MMDMDWASVGKVVAKSAPIIGTLLGGSAGGAVGSIVATVLGVENEPQKIADAIKHDPDALVKLKRYEMEHERELEKIQFQTLAVELKDIANARMHNKHSIMPLLICCYLSIAITVFTVMLMLMEIPPSNMRMIDTLFGSFLTAWLGSLTYWVGTTRSSADKTKLLGK